MSDIDWDLEEEFMDIKNIGIVKNLDNLSQPVME